MDRPDYSRVRTLRKTVRFSRRQLLETSSAVAITAGLFPDSIWGAASTRYDFDDPEDNLEAFVKISGDLDGKEVFLWSSGRVFGSTPGDMAEPLADFHACRKQRYVRIADGYRCLYRGMIIFFDLTTGEILQSFANPFTGKRTQVTHYRTELGEFTMTPQGYRGGVTEIGESGVPRDAPFILDWTVVGDDVWVVQDERLKYTRPSGGGTRIDNLLSRYHCRLSELTDGSVSTVACDMAWQAELTWFPWMGMGDHPGHIFWGGIGRKYHAIDDLPDRVVTAAEALWPGALEKPLETSA